MQKVVESVMEKKIQEKQLHIFEGVESSKLSKILLQTVEQS